MTYAKRRDYLAEGHCRPRPPARGAGADRGDVRYEHRQPEQPPRRGVDGGSRPRRRPRGYEAGAARTAVRYVRRAARHHGRAGMHGTCSRCAAKPASAPHRIPEVNDRACTHPKIQDGSRVTWTWGRTASYAEHRFNRPPRRRTRTQCVALGRPRGHAGARARQIDDVADAPPCPRLRRSQVPVLRRAEARHIAKAPGGKPSCIVRREKCTGQWRGNAMVVRLRRGRMPARRRVESIASTIRRHIEVSDETQPLPLPVLRRGRPAWTCAGGKSCAATAAPACATRTTLLARVRLPRGTVARRL